MEKSKNLQAAFDKLNKMFGTNSVTVLGEMEPINENLLSSGSLLIDSALGGGIGYGRIVELYGVESSGKSTLSLHFAAQCQKEGGVVAYVDTENALDVEYAKKLGVNVEDLVFAQPQSAEEALEIVDVLAQSGEVNLIILDSVAALAPQAELNGEMSDMTIGLVARLMSKALRKITATLNQNKCAVIFINQIREKVSTGFSMGPSETTTGGRALKFFASQRIELRKTTAIKDGEDVIGANIKVKIPKNKINIPLKSVTVPLIFGKGFSPENEVIDLAIEYGLCDKSGAWFTAHDGTRVQGKSKLMDYYNLNNDKLLELREKVVAILKNVDLKIEYNINPDTGEFIED